MSEWTGDGARLPARRSLEHLHELRTSVGWTQIELAERLGVQQAAVSKLERRDNPTVSALGNYVGALGGELIILVRFRGVVFELLPKPEEPPISR